MFRIEARDDFIIAWTTEGSASFMAKVGSALVCKRLASFSAAVSCSSTWLPLRCDLSERKLNVLDFCRDLRWAGLACCSAVVAVVVVEGP